MSGELKIGELASAAGVSCDTIRYYERLKLLPRATRSSAGYRLYTGADVERTRFIKQAQTLGLSLDEIKFLLTSKGGARECQKVRDLLRAKLSELDRRLKVMRDFRRKLSAHLVACERQLEMAGDAAECPVLIQIAHTESEPKGAALGRRKKR